MDRPRLLTPAGNGLIQSVGMSRRSVLGLGAAAAAALVVPGCSRGRSDEPAPAGPATFATGNKGGVYNEFGSGLAKLVSEVTGMELQPVVTNGSVDNLQRVAGMKADMGFTTSDTALGAYEGTGMFDSGRPQVHRAGPDVRQLRARRGPDRVERSVATGQGPEGPDAGVNVGP